MGSSGPHGYGENTGECKEEGAKPKESESQEKEPRGQTPFLGGMGGIMSSSDVVSLQWPAHSGQ